MRHYIHVDTEKSARSHCRLIFVRFKRNSISPKMPKLDFFLTKLVFSSSLCKFVEINLVFVWLKPFLNNFWEKLFKKHGKYEGCGDIIGQNPETRIQSAKLVVKMQKLSSPAFSLQVLGWKSHKKFAWVMSVVLY